MRQSLDLKISGLSDRSDETVQQLRRELEEEKRSTLRLQQSLDVTKSQLEMYKKTSLIMSPFNSDDAKLKEEVVYYFYLFIGFMYVWAYKLAGSCT